MSEGDIKMANGHMRVAVLQGQWFSHSHITWGWEVTDDGLVRREAGEDPPHRILLYRGRFPSYGRRKAGTINDWALFERRWEQAPDLIYDYRSIRHAREPANWGELVRFEYADDQHRGY
jgi:hypothetical protein